MSVWLAIGLGGAVGAMARYAVGRLVHYMWPAQQFPLATLIVNVIGCAALGLVVGAVDPGRLSARPSLVAFVTVGVLGGFTTFSAFGLDTVVLLRAGMTGQAVANVLAQVLFGVAGVYLGMLLTQAPR